MIENGLVDWDDLKSLVEYWLYSCDIGQWCDHRDINQDGKVDFVDFAVLASYWFESNL